MNRSLLFAILLLLWSRTVAGQTRPDSLAHRQLVQVFQQDLNREFADPKESPLTAAERQAFTTLPFYPTRYAYMVQAQLLHDSTSRPFAMETSTAHRPLYRKYGELRFVLNGQAQRLSTTYLCPSPTSPTATAATAGAATSICAFRQRAAAG